MQLKFRYLTLCIVSTFIIILYKYSKYENPNTPSNFIDHFNDLFEYPAKIDDKILPLDTKYCDMSSCFDFERCNKFSIYIYPQNYQPSTTYKNLLNALSKSKYVTKDPSDACILIPSLDTLDRDPLSPNFLKITNKDIKNNAKYWENGKNHLIFNLYTGTYPDYSPKFDINIGKAIYIAANLLNYDYRFNFDISLPLFNEQFTIDSFNKTILPNYTPNKHYLLTFKGKRYLYGYGSEARNALYHLHNGKNIVLLTTCKHGDGWEKFKDERCDYDNYEYDKYDYESLLVNATFCLVPRGRRLASYRFLEVLRAGCIPVILSNGWILPFSEVIDWSRAAIVYDERMLFTLGDLLYSIPEDRVMRMRNQVYIIYQNYFSSFQKIVDTILEILKDRVFLSAAHPYDVWNSRPGALVVDFQYSRSLSDFPFYYRTHDIALKNTFTVTILVASPQPSFSVGSRLNRLLNECAKSTNISRVVLIWISNATPPSKLTKDYYNVVISIYRPPVKSREAKFFVDTSAFETDAIFGVDENETVVASEMDFAFSVWQSFPQSLVGIRAFSHDIIREKAGVGDSPPGPVAYKLNAQTSNSYSMISTTAVIYHRYYNYLYHHALHPTVKSIVSKYEAVGSLFVADIAMNMLVTSITGKAPIKIGPREFMPDSWFLDDSKHNPHPAVAPFIPGTRSNQVSLLETAFEDILNTQAFPFFPLILSVARADPLLFKDRLSVARKKYSDLEVLPEDA